MPKKLDIPQENELTPEETTPPQETLTIPKRTLAFASAGKRTAEFGGADWWRRDRRKPSAFGVIEKRSSLFQYGALTARGTTTMARTPSADALATKRLMSAVGGKAYRTSLWCEPQWGQSDTAQSGTVKASSNSAAGSA